MNLVELNGVKLYNLTGLQGIPEWTSRQEKRSLLRANSTLAKNFQLIQELEMPDASTFISCCPNQQHLFLLGRYKPRVKCFELNNLSLKFERCLDHLPHHMTFLSDDYTKFALVQDERFIEVHYAGGQYFNFRIPKPGVDSCYCPRSCDLFISSSSNMIYRMNLSEGRFNTPLERSINKGSSFSYTASAYDLCYNVVYASSNGGRLDGWDTRTGSHVMGIDIASHAPRPDDVSNAKTIGKQGSVSCTTLTCKDSLNVAVGTSEGMVYIYDIRQNRTPWHSRDTNYRDSVKSISIHEDKVISMLPHCVKIWNIDDGKIFVGFDTGVHRLNHMHNIKNSGLLFFANEAPKVLTYFIPMLGEAPPWAHQLDKLVYEFEPEETTMYDGFKFLTRQQLSQIGMLGLIGTKYLRSYMHGYFISIKLFTRIKQKIEEKKSTKIKAEKTSKHNIDVTETPSTTQAPTLQPSEKLDEVSKTDSRFQKLLTNPKLKYSTTDKESDLMRMHESRLQKRRRRKAERKERAAWSKKLLEEKSGKQASDSGGDSDNDDLMLSSDSD